MSIEVVRDVVAIAGTIVAACVGFWGLYRWRTDRKMAQAEFLEGLMKQFADDEILRLICAFDSDGEANKYFGNLSDVENRKVIEKSLTLMSYLCHLHQNDIISPKAFSMFEGRLRKMLADEQVRNYLTSELKDVSANSGAYASLVEFMRAAGIELDCPAPQSVGEDDSVAESAKDLTTEDFDQPTAIIKINRLYRDGMSDSEVYEKVRGWWRLRLDVAKHVTLVLAVANGVVKGVYKANDWLAAIDPAEAGRIGFVGEPAEKTVRDKFIGRSVRTLFGKGAANPVRYFNVK